MRSRPNIQRWPWQQTSEFVHWSEIRPLLLKPLSVMVFLVVSTSWKSVHKNIPPPTSSRLIIIIIRLSCREHPVPAWPRRSVRRRSCGRGWCLKQPGEKTAVDYNCFTMTWRNIKKRNKRTKFWLHAPWFSEWRPRRHHKYARSNLVVPNATVPVAVTGKMDIERAITLGSESPIFSLSILILESQHLGRAELFQVCNMLPASCKITPSEFFKDEMCILFCRCVVINVRKVGLFGSSSFI